MREASIGGDSINYDNMTNYVELDTQNMNDSYKGIKLTPAMKQYVKAKMEYPDCILLFRMGDFYETFFDDAVDCSNILDITLTARGKGETKAPLAGIPYHALDPYLAKLVRAGKKVAICEQLQDPKEAVGIVKRGVIRVHTPGTVMENDILTANQNNYICSIYQKLDKYGISFCDISTAEFITNTLNEKELLLCLSKYNPKECIMPESLVLNKKLMDTLRRNDCFVYPQENKIFSVQNAKSVLLEHFNPANQNLNLLNLSDVNINSSGGLLIYLIKTSFNKLNYINDIKKIEFSNSLILDGSTIKNLELLKNIHDGTRKGTLLSVVDKTKTNMGARLLKKWIVGPITNVDGLNARYIAVESFIKNQIDLEELRDKFDFMSDLERLIARVNFGNVNPKELMALRMSLESLDDIKLILSKQDSKLLDDLSNFGSVDKINELIGLINQSIKDEPSTLIRNGNIIQDGFSSELDELRDIINGGKNWISNLECEMREKTKINTLKVGYNKVFGYYIELTGKNRNNSIPSNFIRKQTLANAERYITPELKEKEAILLNAQSKINDLEYEIFVRVVGELKKYSELVKLISNKLGVIDILASFAFVSYNNSYVRPVISDEHDNLNLVDSRHPVIELSEKYFIKNNCDFNDDNKVMIITGPNMAGKSTYMRQVALIQIMAQMGCFVPATSASLSVVNRVFTRIGAYDDIVSGQSTFMVEMNEVATILNNFDNKSLIILDEIGRGTSTFDGISIAWSVVEEIAKKNSKCLFATHYHQLNNLSGYFSNIKNYHITVKETDDDIVFLRKIVEGGTDKSYGIQVAKLAGVPEIVIDRSKQIMSQLELDDDISKNIHKNLKKSKTKVSSDTSSKEKKHDLDPLNKDHYNQDNLNTYFSE